MKNTKHKKTEINQIRFFDNTYKSQIDEHEFEEIKAYSANIEITLTLDELKESKKFTIQVSGKENEAHAAEIPNSSANFCDYADQDFASEHFDATEILKLLEKENDLENNFDYLKENGETL